MRLRQMRIEAGLSQVQLAQQMQIDPSIVRHVEAGRTKAYPRFRRVAASVLGVEEGDLFADEEAPQG